MAAGGRGSRRGSRRGRGRCVSQVLFPRCLSSVAFYNGACCPSLRLQPAGSEWEGKGREPASVQRLDSSGCRQGGEPAQALGSGLRGRGRWRLDQA